jgi:hypothetical protein
MTKKQSTSSELTPRRATEPVARATVEQIARDGRT